MTATLFLEMKRLEPADMPLALALADSERGDDPDSESFGLDASVELLKGCRAWGMWIKGALSGAVWVMDTPDAAVVRALAIGRGWRCTGLFVWMLSELASGLRRDGAAGIRLAVAGGGYRLGEGLEEAGFVRPADGAEAFPAGTWSYRGA